jgi:translation initiation factor IF-1
LLKVKYLWALLVLPLIWFLLLVAVSIPAVGHARGYIKVVKGDYSEKSAIASADALNSDINRVFSIIDLPVSKQISSLFGLNFSNIKNEITAAVSAGPILAGADKPRKYLISFQNSAEARGTGGILGAYALIELDKGNLKILQTGSNASLAGMSSREIPVVMPAEFLKLYGKNPAILQNSNLSPHFPYGAQVWLGLWKARYGQQLDGVIAVDPTALSYVLRATGEITLKSGEKITSENVVEETLKNAYERYEKDNDARKQYLVDIMNATAAKLTKGEYSKIKMAKALRDGIKANRILIYSTNKDAQEKLAAVKLGGELGLDVNNEYRTVIQNIDASKLDYYLDRSVEIESKSCEKDRQTQVRIRVTNTLKTGVGLSPYVLTRADKGKPASLVTGAHRFKVFIYGPTNARLVSVSREKRTADLGGASVERKRPIYVADVDLAPGASEELLANFSGGVGKISFVDQPLVLETKLSIKDKC